MYFTGNILFIFIGIGFPFAHVDLEIAPIERVCFGSMAGMDAVDSGVEEWSQIGLGNTEVTCLVLQPASNRPLVARNIRRLVTRRISGFSLFDSGMKYHV